VEYVNAGGALIIYRREAVNRFFGIPVKNDTFARSFGSSGYGNIY
jgi:hypothetical protein